jgi:hypothetical protein
MRIPSIPLVIAALFLLLPLGATAQEGAEAVFGKFHRAMLAGNLDEMNRYGTPGGGTEIAKMPAEGRKQILELMKNATPKRYKITGRQQTDGGNSVTFRMTGTGASAFGLNANPQEGMVRLVKQGGEWKVDDVKWKDAGPASAPATGMTPPVLDGKAPPAKPPCVIKPVMSDEEIDRCR